uniref:Vesicle transport v-SNARE N-terminal domain-containing protein n=1 Tax=Oryza meridionalis TaxID=40149 RepID=A0A0E0EQC8_9ORYZ
MLLLLVPCLIRYPTMGINYKVQFRFPLSMCNLQSQYVTTSRELLEKLAAENTSEGISSIAKGRLNEYSERIEELAARLASLVPGYENAVEAIRKEESYLEGEQIRSPIALSPGLRRRLTNLHEDLTDEIVELACQLKDSSLMMNQSVQATEKILDSTERAVAYSLAGTDRANARAVEVSSLTSKTTCFQWFLLFVMTCMFIMVVLLIRVT